MSDTTEKRLKVSREGVVLIKSFEGFRAVAQPRPNGGWVIGYGHTRSAREGLTVSEPDAELLLQYDLMPVVAALNAQAPGWLNQHQFDALASYVFSTGVDGFGGSEVLRRLRANAPDEAADAMVGWPEITPADAVVRRRAAERALFVAAADTPVTLAQLMAAPLPPPPYQPPVEVAPEPAQAEGIEAEAVVGDISDDAGQPVDTLADEPLEDAAAIEGEVEVADAPIVEAPVEDPEAASEEPVAEAASGAEFDAKPVLAESAEVERTSEPRVEPETVADADTTEHQGEEAASPPEDAPMLGDAVAEVIVAIEAENGGSVAEPEPAVEPAQDGAEPTIQTVEEVAPASDALEADAPAPEPALAEVAQAESVAAPDSNVAETVVESAEIRAPAEATPALPSAIGHRFSPYANVVVGPLLGIGGGMSAASAASDNAAPPPPVEPLDVDAVAEAPLEFPVVSEPGVEVEAVPADYAAHSAVEDAPGLVLTPPDERDPPIIRPAWADADRDFTSDDQSALFDEPLQIAPGAILRHEVIATPRRTDWSETSAFVAMGGIGLVSFGAAMAAFRRAGEQASGGDQTAVVGWVLALIALICVGVSGYNLFRHWTSERQSN